MEISSEQKEKLEEIGRSHNLRFVILHGSYAKRIPQKGSDLDIAILGKQKPPLDEILEIHAELAQIFGDNRNRELDLKTLHGIDSLFRYEVICDGLLLYGDPTDYEEFKAYAYRDYTDSADLRGLEFTLLKKSIGALTKRYAGYAK